jgi:hypothetical protein
MSSRSVKERLFCLTLQTTHANGLMGPEWREIRHSGPIRRPFLVLYYLGSPAYLDGSNGF